MSKLTKWASKHSAWAPTVVRVVLGLAFLLHGWQKVTGIGGVVGFFGTLGLPAWTAYLVAYTELIGGAAVLVGFWTRYAAVLLGAVMIGAITLAKAKMGFLGGYEMDLAFLAMAVSLVLTGPGKLNLELAVCKKEC